MQGLAVMRRPDFNTLNSSGGRAVALIVTAYLALRIAVSIGYLMSEYIFYKKNNWNLELDSNNPCWMQSTIKQYLGYLPIGRIKFGVELCWIAIRLVLMAAIVYAAFG